MSVPDVSDVARASHGDAGHVRIFDTTLRDGEQSPGCTLSAAEKLEVAHALARLGVDVIEAGFPAASPDDHDAVRAIAAEVGQRRDGREPPIVCALARATRADIDAAASALAPAARPRIHTFLASSDLHLEHKLRMTRAEALARVRDMVAYARSRVADVEFSPEDAGRSDPAFLHHVVDAAVAAGATTINLPDTVGYTTPDEFGAMVRGVVARVPAGVVVSVHCHDDLGMATANTLAGLRAGARQAEVAVNGIGERAGNTALEEVVMALRARQALFGLRTGVDTTQLGRVSRLVSARTGMVVQPNKAIVGANAFAHESGIHQDGMLKHESTYEIMRPGEVGAGATRLVLGKHSGRHALGERLRELGYVLGEADLDRAFADFKRLADRKKQVSDADLEAIAMSGRDAHAEWTLADLQVGCGTLGLPTASVRLRHSDGHATVKVAVGSGPVDACYKAVDEIVGTGATLLEYVVQAITDGIDALGDVTVRIRAGDGRIIHGRGADTDIIVASVRAYLAALNRIGPAGATNAQAVKGKSGKEVGHVATHAV